MDKSAKYKLFQRITGWSSDKMRFNAKALNDLLGDSEGNNTEITADDITPELLEDTDIHKKIVNFGLTDEEIAALTVVHEAEYASSVYFNDVNGHFYVNIESIKRNNANLTASGVYSFKNDEYIALTTQNGKTIVLKQEYFQNESDTEVYSYHTKYTNFDESIAITFDGEAGQLDMEYCAGIQVGNIY